jgi:hypothetical protein
MYVLAHVKLEVVWALETVWTLWREIERLLGHPARSILIVCRLRCIGYIFYPHNTG